MKKERHEYDFVCDSCQELKTKRLDAPAANQFEALPDGWEIVFIDYKRLDPNNGFKPDNRMWLNLCPRCKPSEGTVGATPEAVREDDRRWFTKLFRAGRFPKKEHTPDV